eukprot:GHRR01006581.1.p1 GENE.GHRR01006581.1~~GHRR01006581.1.p1  ORF type:complete len:140 (+),score=25.47 GHRR01006581.1:117-536(+)
MAIQDLKFEDRHCSQPAFQVGLIVWFWLFCAVCCAVLVLALLDVGVPKGCNDMPTEVVWKAMHLRKLMLLSCFLLSTVAVLWWGLGGAGLACTNCENKLTLLGSNLQFVSGYLLALLVALVEKGNVAQHTLSGWSGTGP